MVRGKSNYAHPCKLSQPTFLFSRHFVIPHPDEWCSMGADPRRPGLIRSALLPTSRIRFRFPKTITEDNTMDIISTIRGGYLTTLGNNPL